MLYLNEQIKQTEFKEYYVDVEYNRNENKLKTIRNGNYEIIAITCDLIIHSRGTFVEQDNLLVLEMKKSSAPQVEKEKDRERLCALTKSTFDDIWSFDGTCHPEHVCRYLLGIFYEINFQRRE